MSGEESFEGFKFTKAKLQGRWKDLGSVGKKLEGMYTKGETHDGLAYVEPGLFRMEPSGVLNAALADARQMNGNDTLTIAQLLAYRPAQKYTKWDCNHVFRNLRGLKKFNSHSIYCQICGDRDNAWPMRGELCIDCFCREVSNIQEYAESEYGFHMKFDDAADWVRRHDFKADRLFRLAKWLYKCLVKRQTWDRVLAYHAMKGISLGRWPSQDSRYED